MISGAIHLHMFTLFTIWWHLNCV